MRLSHFGIAAPKFCSVRKPTAWESISGLQVVFSQKWSSVDPCLWVTPRLTRSSKFSKSWVRQMRIIGQMHWSYQTLNRLSPSSAAFTWASIHPRWMSSRWIFFQALWHWTQIDAFQLWQLFSIPTSMILIDQGSTNAVSELQHFKLQSALKTCMMTAVLHLNVIRCIIFSSFRRSIRLNAKYCSKKFAPIALLACKICTYYLLSLLIS